MSDRSVQSAVAAGEIENGFGEALDQTQEPSSKDCQAQKGN